jgi:rRNA processing protein Gar1
VLLAFTPTGRLTARALGARFPVEGSELTDARGRPIGTVSRVFGPVERPYLALRPHRPFRADEAAGLIGATLKFGGE